MECPLWKLLISSRLINKHGYHRNLVGIIYGMSSMKIAHFVPIGYQTWLPPKLGRSIYGMSSMKIAHFIPIGWQTWPPHAILVSDWSISRKSSPLKLLSHMNRNLVGSIYMYGRLCIKFSQSRMKGVRHLYLLYVFRDIILIQLHFLYNNTRWFNLWFI
jgi:hypothetical protein